MDDPKTNGVGIGIQYFPLAATEPEVCDAPYASAEVDVQGLPDVGAAIALDLEPAPGVGR